MSANSKFTPFKPRLRALLYSLFHLIVPKAPSACMLLFIRKSARKEKQISQGRCQTHFIFSFRISVRKSVRNAIEN